MTQYRSPYYRVVGADLPSRSELESAFLRDVDAAWRLYDMPVRVAYLTELTRVFSFSMFFGEADTPVLRARIDAFQRERMLRFVQEGLIPQAVEQQKARPSASRDGQNSC